MKSTIFLILTTVIMPSISGFFFLPWSFGWCKNPDVVQNFNSTSFFTGRWYEQKGYRNPLQNGICPTLMSRQSSNGAINLITYHFNPLTMRYVVKKGRVASSYLNTNVGFVVISFAGIFHINIEMPTYIVASDDQRWALIYACYQGLFNKIEMSFAVTRNRTVDADVLQEVDQAISNAGFDLSRYADAINVGCRLKEPEV